MPLNHSMQADAGVPPAPLMLARWAERGQIALRPR